MHMLYYLCCGKLEVIVGQAIRCCYQSLTANPLDIFKMWYRSYISALYRLERRRMFWTDTANYVMVEVNNFACNTHRLFPVIVVEANADLSGKRKRQ